MDDIELPAVYDELTWQEKRKVREQYAALQEGKCAHCGELLTEQPSNDVMQLELDKRLFPPNFFKFPVHLHHCHYTGMTIGAIHNRCNAVLWQYHGQ